MVYVSENDSADGIAHAIRRTMPIWQLSALFGDFPVTELVQMGVDKIRMNANRQTGHVDVAALSTDPFTSAHRKYLAHICVDGTHTANTTAPVSGVAALPPHVLQIIKTYYVAGRVNNLTQWSLVCRSFAKVPRADLQSIVPLAALPFDPPNDVATLPAREQARAVLWLAERFNFCAAGAIVPWVMATSQASLQLYTALVMNFVTKPMFSAGRRVAVVMDSDRPTYYVRQDTSLVEVEYQNQPALNPWFRALSIENQWSAGTVVSALDAVGLTGALKLHTLSSPYGAADFLRTNPQNALTTLRFHRHAVVRPELLEATAATLQELCGPFVLTGRYPKLVTARLFLSGNEDQALGPKVELPCLTSLDLYGAIKCPSLEHLPDNSEIKRLRWTAPSVMCQSAHRYANARDMAGLARLTKLRHLWAVGVVPSISVLMANVINSLPLWSLCIKLAIRARPTNDFPEAWSPARLRTMLSDRCHRGKDIQIRPRNSNAPWYVTHNATIRAALDASEAMHEEHKRVEIKGTSLIISKHPGGLITMTIGPQTFEVRREPFVTLEMTDRCVGGILDDISRMRHLFRQLILLSPNTELKEHISQHYRRTLAPMTVYG